VTSQTQKAFRTTIHYGHTKDLATESKLVRKLDWSKRIRQKYGDPSLNTQHKIKNESIPPGINCAYGRITHKGFGKMVKDTGFTPTRLNTKLRPDNETHHPRHTHHKVSQLTSISIHQEKKGPFRDRKREGNHLSSRKGRSVEFVERGEVIRWSNEQTLWSPEGHNSIE